MATIIISLVFCLWFFLSSVPAHSDNGDDQGVVSFIARREFATGGNPPVSVAVGDFNGDGRLDLVTVSPTLCCPARTTHDTVNVLLGQGDGTFQANPDLILGSNLGSVAVAVGDFNGDRKLDLAVANQFDNTVSILLGRGDGSFQAGSVVGVGTHPVALTIGDFNGDARLDLAVVNSPMGPPNQPTPPGTVSILLGQGDGTFQAGSTTAVGPGPTAVTGGDLNGDGHLDLAVANSSGSTVSILLGQGDGTFQAAPLVAAVVPRDVAMGDFNGDGSQDLAVANAQSNTVSILLGRGDGTFQAAPNVAVGSVPISIAVGDFNGDGRPDLAVANNNNTVSILLGHGNGMFQTTLAVAVGLFPGTAVAGDFNGDGHLDLATANAGADTVSILLGMGDGTFLAALALAVSTDPASHPASIGLADFNGDGHVDLGVADSSPAVNAVFVLQGRGDGSFQNGTNVGVGLGLEPTFVVAGDFNGDGSQDLAVANAQSNTVSILLGRGDGTFQAAPNVAVGSVPVSIAVGDFNGDGLPDLAVVNLFGASVSIRLSRGDGTFQSAPTLAVGFDPRSVVVADFNGDGRLDLAVANSNANPSREPGSVSILLGQGNGTFQKMPDIIVGVQALSVAVGDFNNDGRPDLAAVNSFSNTVSILLGQGNGTFQFAPDIAVGGPPIDPQGNAFGPSPSSVAVGDFNSDGRTDLAVAIGGNYVSILLGQGNGTFLEAFLAGVGSTPLFVTVGDFNGDGRPDLATADFHGTVSILINNSAAGIVNNLVSLESFESTFVEPPLNPPPEAPAGTFEILAEFRNISESNICDPFFEIVQLSGSNRLLGVFAVQSGGAQIQGLDGAVLNHPPLMLGSTKSMLFKFVVGLQTRQTFNFFVNMRGLPHSPRSACPSEFD